MKRDILCNKCAKDRREQYPTDTPYPEEHIKFVHGTARGDMLCDGCTYRTEIKKGEECCAFSSWADYGGIPYNEWEHEFIEFTPPEGTIGAKKTHTLSGFAKTRECYLDGKPLDPRPSQRLHNHSPDNFNWGYGGSGPAQLALAVVLAITGKPNGYQQFKWTVIAAIPQNKDFRINFIL
jgi:hypothetical protein